MTTLTLTLSLLVSPANATEDPAADAVTQAWAIGAGAYGGGAVGYLVGEAMEESEEAHQYEGVVAGGLVGAAIGGTTVMLLDKELDLSLDQSVFLASSTAVGAFSGTMLGRATIPLEDAGGAERAHAAGLAGAMAGTGIGFLVKGPEVSDTLHFDLATGVGAFAGAGVAPALGFEPGEGRQERAAFQLAGAAGLGSAAIAYGQLAENSPNEAAWALSLGHGAWIGAWAPSLFDDYVSEEQVLGGTRAGLGLGYAGALVMASIQNPSPKSAALQGVGIASGSALGAGIPMVLADDLETRDFAGPMLASGIAGQVLGASVAPHYNLTRDDAVLVGAMGAWTGYQIAGWSAYAATTDGAPHEPLGYALVAGGSGTLLTMSLAPALDVPASGSAMLLSGGGWGTFYGGMAGQVVDSSPDETWMLMMGSGNAALVGTAVAEAAGWTPTWQDVATINGYGMLGTATGGLVGVIALYDEDDWSPMATSTLVGTTVGLGVGSVLSARNDHASDVASTSLPDIDLGRSRWQPNVSARPWMDDDGNPGAWVELSLTEVASNRG